MLIDEIAEKTNKLGINMFSICQVEKGVYTKKQLKEANEKNNVYSVSKSVTSLVFGILADHGLIDFKKECIASIFESTGIKIPDGWTNVNPVHLLTHTTGYEEGGLDIDCEDASSWDTQDYLEKALNQPLLYHPGEKMVYSDANYYLISRIISQKTGRTIQDLAREWLFNPLDITGAAWATCPQGYGMGATGLFLSVEDMAKIGEMLLNKGLKKEKQIIPEWWIQEMVIRRTAPSHNSDDGYGYGFWVRSDTNAYMANGMLGQLIYISPDKERVIAWQSCTRNCNIGALANFLIQRDKEM